MGRIARCWIAEGFSKSTHSVERQREARESRGEERLAVGVNSTQEIFLESESVESGGLRRRNVSGSTASEGRGLTIETDSEVSKMSFASLFESICSTGTSVVSTVQLRDCRGEDWRKGDRIGLFSTNSTPTQHHRAGDAGRVLLTDMVTPTTQPRDKVKS